jgi:hypothetical protein
VFKLLDKLQQARRRPSQAIEPKLRVLQIGQTSPNSIAFLAQSPCYFLSPGQDFFVNVFFPNAAGGGGRPTAFRHLLFPRYFYPFRPRTLHMAMMLIGFAGLGFAAYRRRKQGAARAFA